MTPRMLIFALLVALGAQVAACTRTGEPRRVVTLVTHSSPGGGSDVFLREMAPHLSRIMGETFIVENIQGGSGARAMATLARARPDGRMFYATTPTFIATSLLSRPAAKYTDLEPLVNLFFDPEVIYTAADSKFGNAAGGHRPRPSGRGKWGAANPASLERQVLEQLKEKAGVAPAVTTFEGGGDMLINVLNHTLDMGVGELQEIRSQLDAGGSACWRWSVRSDCRNSPISRRSGNRGSISRCASFAGWQGRRERRLTSSRCGRRQFPGCSRIRASRKIYLANSLQPGFIPHAEYVGFMGEVRQGDGGVLQGCGRDRVMDRDVVFGSATLVDQRNLLLACDGHSCQSARGCHRSPGTAEGLRHPAGRRSSLIVICGMALAPAGLKARVIRSPPDRRSSSSASGRRGASRACWRSVSCTSLLAPWLGYTLSIAGLDPWLPRTTRAAGYPPCCDRGGIGGALFFLVAVRRADAHPAAAGMVALVVVIPAFADAFTVGSALAAVGGVAWGILGGALPGISPSITMALLLPFTYGMDPHVRHRPARFHVCGRGIRRVDSRHSHRHPGDERRRRHRPRRLRDEAAGKGRRGARNLTLFGLRRRRVRIARAGAPDRAPVEGWPLPSRRRCTSRSACSVSVSLHRCRAIHS